MAVLAPALVRARTENNLRWPNRDRSSDGWIGDPSHAASGLPENGGSDHNPNRRGVVNALDIDVDGIDVPFLLALLIRHPSVNYVIWNRSIWSRSRGFARHAYTGSNPHTGHLHVSLLQTPAAENSTTPWGIFTGVVIIPVVNPGGGPIELSWAQRLAAAMPELDRSTLVRGSVRKLQALITVDGFTLTVDGRFGDRTSEAVRAYQRKHGLVDDGIVGPKTWGKLLGALPTTKRGSGPVETKMAQALLNVFGAGLKVDGDFGDRTTAAVKAFQTRFGLTRDGLIGPITWTALLTR